MLDILVEGNFTLYQEKGMAYLVGSKNQVITLQENMQETQIDNYQNLAETVCSEQIKQEQKQDYQTKGGQYDIQLS